MIHVCYGLYDGNGHYSKFTGTSILSMFENLSTPPRSVTVHLLHDNTLTEDNRDKFSYIAGQYNQCIRFYNVEKLCAENIKQIQSLFSEHKAFKIFSIGTMFRLLMPEIFPQDVCKVIYLDSDIIVNLDINELWKIPLEDKILAVRQEDENGIATLDFPLCKDGLVNPKDYFNAGVLVVNLNKLRGADYEAFQAGIKFIAANPQYNQNMDQEIINYCFSKNTVKLPSKFNLFVRSVRGNSDVQTSNCICHYLGKALNLNMNDKFNRLWFEYFEKTPWFNKNIIANFYKEFGNFNIEQKNFAVKTTAIMSGKSRAFFTLASNFETLRQIFYIRENEEIIPAVNSESIQVLKESMRNSEGKKIYFILIGGYEILRNELMKEGFVEGRDFLNAVNFLSEIHGIPLNIYFENQLIKSL